MDAKVNVLVLLVDRGEDIFISIWNLHRSPNLWDDADKFIPDRWPLDGLNPNETNQNFWYVAQCYLILHELSGFHPFFTSSVTLLHHVYK